MYSSSQSFFLLLHIWCDIEPTDESILCRYNKREEDFSALKDYNDYLEEVECMS